MLQSLIPEENKINNVSGYCKPIMCKIITQLGLRLMQGITNLEDNWGI